jgi:predicted secreted protein
LLNGASYTDALSFRDFKTDSLYDVKLSQAVVESGGNASSSFSISVVINEKSGSVKRFEAGNPGIKRAGVSGYAIRQILVAPDERMLVFIVEKKMATDKGAGLRYMVETVRIP